MSTVTVPGRTAPTGVRIALLATDALVWAFAALQVVLAVAIVLRAWWVAPLFLLATGFLALGLVRRCRTNLLRGAFFALLAPMVVGAAAVEPFEPIHHVVRLIFVAVMLDAWHQTRRISASATPPASQA